MPALPYWLWPGDGRPTREIDSEITEELQLHLDLLAEEHERSGLARDDAKRQAAERFGDFDSILRRCRVEKQGDVPMLKRVQATLIGLLLAAVVFMGWQQWAMATRAEATWRIMDGISGRLSDISDRLHQLEPERLARDAPVNPIQRGPYGGGESSYGETGLTGLFPPSSAASWPGESPTPQRNTVVVRSEAGEPIANAVLHVTWKQRSGWTQTEFSREGYTDEAGRYILPVDDRKLVVSAISAYAPGYAFETVAPAVSGPEGDQSVEIVLRPGAIRRLRLVRRKETSDPQPAERVQVRPVKRVDEQGRPHAFTTSGKAATRTDAVGTAEIDWFAAGDEATIEYREPLTEKWRKISFEVLGNGDELIAVDVIGGEVSTWDYSKPPAVEADGYAGGGGFGGAFGGSGGDEFGGTYSSEVRGGYANRKRTRADLTGSATDADGKPIADADVLLIVKTWPNNRFRQDDYAVKTDESGAFVLKGRIPLDGQYGVNAVVVAEGHAIASQYVLVEDPAGEPPEELKFELGESTSTRLIVTDSDGAPLAKALVAPSGRVDENDNETLVYHQGSNPAWKKTDADGVVFVEWFAPGDLGKVSIRPRGGEWQEKKFDVTKGGTVETAVED